MNARAQVASDLYDLAGKMRRLARRLPSCPLRSVALYDSSTLRVAAGLVVAGGYPVHLGEAWRDAGRIQYERYLSKGKIYAGSH